MTEVVFKTYPNIDGIPPGSRRTRMCAHRVTYAQSPKISIWFSWRMPASCLA
jgi:hypothetical protein